MKILVTGASGFIGGKIVENLAKNTDYDVLATGRSSTAKFGHYPNVTYFTQDLKKHFRFCPVMYVFTVPDLPMTDLLMSNSSRIM